MQVCTSLQTDNHTSTPSLSFFTDRMPFLSPNQQCQSTESTKSPRQCIIIRANLTSKSGYFFLLASITMIQMRQQHYRCCENIFLIQRYFCCNGCEQVMCSSKRQSAATANQSMLSDSHEVISFNGCSKHQNLL